MAKPKVFISYKNGHHASESFITSIEAELGADLEILRDVTMQVSKRWTRELYDWLLGCDAAIIILSKDANESDWCRREWAILVARWEVKGIPVIPVNMEDTFFETGILDEIQSTLSFSAKGNTTTKIKDALKDISSLPMTADDFLAAHQGWLSWQYNDAPIFQREPYALSDVYIESDCGELSWKQIKQDRIDPFYEEVNEDRDSLHAEQTKLNTQREECENRSRKPLLNTVMNKLADPDFNELITVQAGPGAGKSAFTLRLANELIQKGLQPILVRFRDLRLHNYSNVADLLDDAIRIGFTDDDSPHPETEVISKKLHESHLLGDAKISKIVIILDGWDEVSLSGNESYRAQLSMVLPKIREYFTENRTSRIRLILTGRPSSEASESGLLKYATPILTIRPIRPEQLEKFAGQISNQLNKSLTLYQDDEHYKQNSSNHSNFEFWRFDKNKLQPVFDHYWKWFSNRSKPNSSSAGDLLGNPLLAYLAFRVFSETDQSAINLVSNPTALYQELLTITIINSGKGQDENLEGTVQRGGKSLRAVLQEVAVTISILRSESVSFEELNARFTDRDLPIRRNLLKNWHEQADSSTALEELVVNYYFKGGNTHLGCEFLHKSFREYLFAEAIYDALLEAAEGSNGVFKPCKSYEYWEDFPQGSKEYQLSRRLAYLLAPQTFDIEVRTHLFWLIDIGISADRTKWLWLRDIMLTLYTWWAEGVLLRHQPTGSRAGPAWQAPYVESLFLQVIPFATKELPAPVRTCVYDSHLGIALLQVTAKIFKCYHGRESDERTFEGRDSSYILYNQDGIRLKPFGENFASSIVARLDSEGWRELNGLGGLYLSHISLKKADLRHISIVEANLTGCDLTGVDLRGAVLVGCDLREVNLRKANLMHADLRQADLSNVNLSNANLSNANLSKANLRHADLSNANLSNSNLIGARIRKANLREANLKGANLRESSLPNANLVEANLRGADLRKANLRNADLRAADLRKTNLTGAELGKSDLRWSNLRWCILTNANLTGAIQNSLSLKWANLEAAQSTLSEIDDR